ncbi:MAG: 1-deoxy-D-xylulose-5-phosphate synthase [Sedimentisphaerales bacterium]|nr:1-deoxy-D-xylulose-5-phosphate synthase [Sedimentisphaerales bacterium]
MQRVNSGKQTRGTGKVKPVPAPSPPERPGIEQGVPDKVGAVRDEWAGMALLAGVNGPGDLKALSTAQLKQLADEIRRLILETVSETGGHLASNLGVVELTLALHYVFDFGQDKLLWDVGHQCYAHKIITGRKEQFRNLRHTGGISGFPNPEESQYDQFVVGHAGTSIGTAIGMALGRAKQGKREKIVALVGDASIVNGTSFEALNNLGLVKRQLLIVLNDNSMAIDPTQGAVAKYLSKIRLSQTYEDLRRTTNDILLHVPFVGKTVEEAIEKIKKSIRMVLPASQLFESLNIPYFGPVDGHDIGSLIQLFGALKQVEHPVILHCHTKKGMGFKPADSLPSKYHSTGPFKINGETTEGHVESDRKSFTDVFGEELTNLAEKDKRIIAITSAMCDGTGLMEFRKRFSDRFYDVGIAESAAVEIAAGMAKSGLRPVVCIYSTFLQRSFDQIFQEVSLQNLPVIFCIDRAGVVGADGPTHHGLMDIGFLRMMPNLVLVAPADAVEMKGALEFAISVERPVCIRYPKDIITGIRVTEATAEPFELGKCVTTRSSQNARATIVSYGSVLAEAMTAAKKLAEEGFEVDVINGRFAAPVDGKIVQLLESGKPVITVEDHGNSCGFGSAILEAAGQRTRGFESSGKVRILGVPRRFIRHNSRVSQLMETGINADKITEAVKQMLT